MDLNFNRMMNAGVSAAAVETAHGSEGIYILENISKGALLDNILKGCRKPGFEKALTAVSDKVIDALLENILDMACLHLGPEVRC